MKKIIAASLLLLNTVNCNGMDSEGQKQLWGNKALVNRVYDESYPNIKFHALSDLLVFEVNKHLKDDDKILFTQKVNDSKIKYIFLNVGEFCTINEVIQGIILTSRLIVSSYIECPNYYLQGVDTVLERIMLTGIMIADKVCSDINFNNLFWSRQFGLPLEKLNVIESNFLKSIDYNCNFAPEEIKEAQEYIINRADEIRKSI